MVRWTQRFPSESFLGGPLAQRLVQRTHNPLVVGSNPTGPTRILYLFLSEVRVGARVNPLDRTGLSHFQLEKRDGPHRMDESRRSFPAPGEEPLRCQPISCVA